MLDFIQNILTGGLTGLIGAGLTLWGDLAKKKADYLHEEKMAELDTRQMQMEAEANIRIAGAQAEGVIAEADASALAASYSADQARYATGGTAKNSAWFVMVDVIRGLVRPSMTVYVMVVVTLIYLELQRLVGGLEAIPVIEAMSIYSTTINSILYVATTVILWWFGIRGARKAIL